MTAVSSIAIVGAACRYPDANSPQELWENALAGRRAFRQIPQERLSLSDYGSLDRSAIDYTYATHAALLENYQFDRAKFRVSAATFRSTDLAHWLALEVAAEALSNAGFPDDLVLPRATTAVIVGNTMTGEFSRASALRLRWPYFRRVLDTVLEGTGQQSDSHASLLRRVESAFKAPFAEPDGETLAGALSNTIAGRICNYFNLQGGGFTVDGACASSLLAVAHACSSLAARDIDVAIVGGVDLSLDPFELVGFARAGALATDDMRIFDAAPTGFWPGEGCGFVVLMREKDAVDAGRSIYAVVRGWGVSSDGAGGLTRPEVEGQVLALERAYARAGLDAGSVAYFEAHGTGTAVGDTTELAALTTVRRRAHPGTSPAAIGSIKANIGHTKAAAGLAGLLKGMLAVHHDIVPPTWGTRDPHPALAAPDALLRLQGRAEPWPTATRRAGVSAMGFGGINVHVVLEGGERASVFRRFWESCSRSWQDAELFLLAARTHAELQAQAEQIAALAPALSTSELTDLAIDLQQRLEGGAYRAAVVASTAAELAANLATVRDAVNSGARRLDTKQGIFVAHTDSAPRVAFLFTGQAAPFRTGGGIWARRFAVVEDLYRRASLPASSDPLDTSLSQPAIVVASLAALRCLESLGLHGDVVIGHSLGELSALRWAGALPDDVSAIELASARGRLMATLSEGPGAMVALATGREAAERLVYGTGASIAGFNAPQQVTVSGLHSAIDRVIERASTQGVAATRLPVAHAFHSSAMGPVTAAYQAVLAATPLKNVTRRGVISTITGKPLTPHADVRDLLAKQLCSPVLFTQAMESAGPVDLMIELGPGHTLAALAKLCGPAPALSVDAAGSSLRPFLLTIGAAFVLGAPIQGQQLAAERFARPFDLGRRRVFLSNPCESPREQLSDEMSVSLVADHVLERTDHVQSAGEAVVPDTCFCLRQIVSRYADLPIDTIEPRARFLSDLHLNSITVAEILVQAARRVGAPPFAAPTDFADSTLADAARALDAARNDGFYRGADIVAGVHPWVRAFIVDEEERPPAVRRGPTQTGQWDIVASVDHPLREQLIELMRAGQNGPGTIVCIDPSATPSLSALLRASQAVMHTDREHRFIIVQQAAVAGGFARSLFLESGTIDVGVVTANFSDPATASRVRAEADVLSGFLDVRYDEKGRRLIPVARVRDTACSGDALLGPADVLLVTGGAKGITAECALAVAKEYGTQLALLGRADPASDATVAANLNRMRAAGVTVRYERADVGDAAAVREAVSRLRHTLGDITGVLHGAGANVPCLIAGLDESAIGATLKPKLDGARHVIDACDPSRLRLFVTFGSIISRTGLRGEAHYALANEQLREFALELERRHSHCHVLALEWSVWSGVGMGERPGQMESLLRQGVQPIALDDGVALFTSWLRTGGPRGALVVSGRFGDVPTFRLADGHLPHVRFLERPRVFYPGVELVADATLSLMNDPYLADHCLDGHQLFPGVLGLEAIVQAATALHNTSDVPELSDVEFARPIIVPADESLVLRTAAYQELGGHVRVHIRSSSTEFAVDHFRATCSWPSSRGTTRTEPSADAGPPVVDERTAERLYGSLFFQSGRFARVRLYTGLFATECLADIDTTDESWFGTYLPAELLLGDPGARDAMLHCVQASVPHWRVVPTAVNRVSFRRVPRGRCRVSARQRSASGEHFTWDLSITDASGEVVEIWDGVHLRALSPLSPTRLPLPLLGPYIERQLTRLGHRTASRVVVVESEQVKNDHVSHAVGAGRAAARRITQVTYSRSDGRPEADNGERVSAAHAGGVTMAVASRGAVGCDVERVSDRPQYVWRDLLGVDRAPVADLLMREVSEPYASSATRVWAALESLKKAGAPIASHLVIDGITDGGWVTMRAGAYAVSTWIADSREHPMISFAVATGDTHAGL